MSHPLRFTVFCVVILLFGFAAHAQTTGSIVGQVLAPDHSPIVSAHLTLVTPNGHTVTAVSSSMDGSFSFQNLASGSYTLHTAAETFRIAETTGIEVAVGRTTSLTVSLQLASAAATVQVSAVTSALDPTQTSSVVNIDRDRVEELPIPSRDYLTFTLLSPFVAASNPAQSAQTPGASSGGFSFGGLRPTSNAILLDGVNDDDEFMGGSRTELSPEAISDFQIVNHGFQAQSGGAAGGSIDVATRSGVNQLHGDAFTFVQNGALNGTQPLGIYPRKPDENRERAGLSLGGPIQRDRTFYYLAAEQEIAQGEDVTDLSPDTVSAINAAAPRFGALGSLQLHSGFFPTTDQQTELSARLDRTLTSREALMMRYAFTNTRSVADAFNTDDLTDLSARGSTFVADNSINSTLTSTLSANGLNQLNFELAQRRFDARTADATTPGVFIPGVALFGTPYFGNDRHFETHVEFSDSFSLQHRNHLFQFGARADRVALRASTPDAARSFFVFPDIPSFTAGNASFFVQSFGQPDTNFAEVRSSAWAQDHWSATHTLTLDYGLRWDDNHLPSPLHQSPWNFSPRAGLAWSPSSRLLKRTVVRSGFGLFYDRFLLSTLNRPLEWNGVTGLTQIAEGASAAAIFRRGIQASQPYASLAPSVFTAQPALRNPYSEVASLELERELPLQTTVTATYQFVHGVHLGRTVNVNLPPPATLTSGNATSLGLAAPAAQQLGQPVFGPARIDPAFDAVNQFSTEANSNFNGATLSVNRQFQDNLEILAGYTWSKTIDDASYDAEQPMNPYNLSAERALSLQDQRNRLTLSGLWLVGPDLDDPADAVAAAHPSPFMRFATGFEFTPILSVTSGFRSNPLTGLDTTQAHIFPFAARPIGFSRNGLVTPAQLDFDLRILRMISIGRGHLDVVAESFNLLNHTNISLLQDAFGTAATPMQNFAAPVNTSTARRLQFSLDYEF